MYQLLMSGAGWPANRGTINGGRVFEYTDDDLEAQFKPDGTLSVDALTKIPALFATETGNRGSQIARAGSITRVRLVGTEYQFDYVLDPNIPGIPNAKLEELAPQLGLDGFETSRTHWAIKDVDLFKVLLQHGATLGARPKVFDLSDDPVDKELISVMMPFSAEFRPVYTAIEGVAAALRLECRRADNIWENDVVIQDVVSLISKSAVVICDLSGKNANVFYETGIAHTLGREVILIAQHEQDVPFDLRHLRYVRYLPNAQGLERLAEQITPRIEALIAAA
jgi:hypothetical protein